MKSHIYRAGPPVIAIFTTVAVWMTYSYTILTSSKPLPFNPILLGALTGVLLQLAVFCVAWIISAEIELYRMNKRLNRTVDPKAELQ